MQKQEFLTFLSMGLLLTLFIFFGLPMANFPSISSFGSLYSLVFNASVSTTVAGADPASITYNFTALPLVTFLFIFVLFTMKIFVVKLNGLYNRCVLLKLGTALIEILSLIFIVVAVNNLYGTLTFTESGESFAFGPHNYGVFVGPILVIIVYALCAVSDVLSILFEMVENNK